MKASLEARSEIWRLARPFAISRGVRTTAEIVVARLEVGDAIGTGECFPYARYDETTRSVLALIEGVKHQFGSLEISESTGDILRAILPCGAARNAIDCAVWNLRSHLSGVPVWKLAGLLEPPKAITTAFTIGLDTPERMGAAADEAKAFPLLKVKLGGTDDDLRVAAVREAAPHARLIVDANESWSPETLPTLTAKLADLGVELIEQPLPADSDACLQDFKSPVTICADESCHDLSSLASCLGKYSAINIKLDKSGGLTEALEMMIMAQDHGLKIMTGCTTATSLAMAPALIIAALSDYVDLDGPLWLSEDRSPGLVYETGVITEWQSGIFGV